jgi:methyl-accepting chemotaxis protein
MKALTRRLRNLRIGVRLAVVLSLCALCVGAAAYNGLASQSRTDAYQKDINEVQDGRQIADELLIAINDVTGWQGLYLADAAAYGVDRALGKDGYNHAGLADATSGVEELFATMDTSALTAEEKSVLDEIEQHFDQFFAEDVKIQEQLRSKGMAALPAIMNSVNGGDAGAAWSAVYEASDSFKTMMDERIAGMYAEMAQMKESGRRSVYIGLALALVLAAAMARTLARSITVPLRSAASFLGGVAAGHLDGRLEVEGKDEASEMATALNEAMGHLGEAMRGMDANAQALASASEELSSVSGEMTGSAQESASQAGLVSAAAEQVSRNVQTVATGTDEMSASIREIALSATSAAGVAAQAVGVAESTSATVVKLGESSAEVGNVISVINSIAEQTNLLALNATIEAARAGEAGKGFAVVANEVKELAQETGKATEDISRRIQAIQSDTDAAVAAITQISGIIAQINDTQTTIASAVEEQTATTNEMSRNVAEAATGAAEIAQNVTGVARTAADTGTAASSTNQAAEELARMAADMQQLVGRFTY